MEINIPLRRCEAAQVPAGEVAQYQSGSERKLLLRLDGSFLDHPRPQFIWLNAPEGPKFEEISNRASVACFGKTRVAIPSLFGEAVSHGRLEPGDLLVLDDGVAIALLGDLGELRLIDLDKLDHAEARNLDYYRVTEWSVQLPDAHTGDWMLLWER